MASYVEDLKKQCVLIQNHLEKDVMRKLGPVPAAMTNAAVEVETLLGGTATKADQKAIDAFRESGRGAEKALKAVNDAIKKLEEVRKAKI